MSESEAAPAPAPAVVEDHISVEAAKKSLDVKLGHRPDRKDLVDHHILHDSHLAPALQAKAEELAKQQTADALAKALEHRPSEDQLREKKILE